MKIFIDNGHGSDTAGKRSPDGRFLEYKFNRSIARRIVADLTDRGYDGYYWSASPDGPISAFDLFFHSSNVNPDHPIFGTTPTLFVSSRM